MKMLDDLKRRYAVDRKNLGAGLHRRPHHGHRVDSRQHGLGHPRGHQPADRSLHDDRRDAHRGAVHQLPDDAHLHHRRPVAGRGELAVRGARRPAAARGVPAGADDGRDPDDDGPVQDGLPRAFRAERGDDRLPERRRRADHRGPAGAVHRLQEPQRERDCPGPGHAPERPQHGPAGPDRRRRVHRADARAPADQARQPVVAGPGDGGRVRARGVRQLRRRCRSSATSPPCPGRCRAS